MCMCLRGPDIKCEDYSITACPIERQGTVMVDREQVKHRGAYGKLPRHAAVV
jgi:hypothetical protein